MVIAPSHLFKAPSCSWHLLLSPLCVLCLTACEKDRPLTERQVDQLLSTQAETAQTSRHLVEHDAQSREQWLALHASLQAELSEIGRRQEQLEARRQELARQRRTDAIVAAAVEFCGATMLCLVPVVMATLLLWPRHREESDELCDYLVEAVVEQQHHVRRLEAKRK